MVKRLKIVGVMGSGAERHDALALPLGALLAQMGVDLLTGGGGGVMEAVAEGFVRVENRVGRSIGVLPGRVVDAGCEAPAGYPNRFVEIVIRTHLPGRGKESGSALSRNAINIASVDAVVVLPGGDGTASEALLARQLGKAALGLGGGGQGEGISQAETLDEVQAFLRSALGLEGGE